MAKKICFSNQKGGVGKTASAQHLIAFLAGRGYKVLGVDLDAQMNLSMLFDIDCSEYEGDGGMSGKTIYQVMKGKSIEEVVLKGVKPNVDFICGSLSLSSADGEFPGVAGLMRLKNALREVEDNYDYVIMDCSPTLGKMTTNALIASDGVIIPYQVGCLTKVGGVQLYQAIKEVRENVNPGLKVYGILVTMYDTRTKVSKKTVLDAEMLAQIVGTKVFDAKIRASSKMRELADTGMDIFEFAPNSTSAKDYIQFGEEILKGEI